MIVKINEIGKKLEERMKEMGINAHILSIRTGIAESSLSDIFRGIAFRKCFNHIEKIADVLNITSLTIVFKRNLSKEEYTKLNENPDFLNLNNLLPEYRKQVFKIVENSNKQKQQMENIKNKNY